MINRVPEELRMEVGEIIQQAWININPKKNKCKQAKLLSEEALERAVKRKEAKGKGEKERHIHFNVKFQNRKERRQPSSVIKAKKQQKTVGWERPEIF